MFTVLTLASLLAGSSPSRAQDGAACSQPVSADDLVAHIDAAVAAIGDDDAFSNEASATLSSLPCLSQPFPTDSAARLYWVIGLDKWMHNDIEAATRAFAAARTTDPQLDTVAPLFPTGNPVRRIMESMAVDDRPTEAITGSVLLDGQPRQDRPTAWPVLLQVLDSAGQVSTTTLLWSGDPTPDIPAPEPLQATAPGDTRPSAHRPLLITAIAGTIAAGATYTLAWMAADTYRTDDSLQQQDYEQLRSRANTLAVLSGGIGVVALGAGVGAVLTW